MPQINTNTFGKIVLFGSGESSASSRKTHELIARSLGRRPHIAILETPAGFEPNSDKVAGRIADYLATKLQNHTPHTAVIPARKRGTPFSPDNPQIVTPLLDANWLFLGPGSPSYAARQLRDSLAVEMIKAQQRLGATLMLASSATLAFSTQTMPVYEIYKVGEELHWQTGVDYFGQLGVPLVIIPHWNNTDGGEELDTSHCYLGTARFDALRAMLPPDMMVLGLDEHTSLVIDLTAESCHVLGTGKVHLLRAGEPAAKEQAFATGSRFATAELGAWDIPPAAQAIQPAVWAEAQARQAARMAPTPVEPPEVVLALLARRQLARANREWATADQLRDQINELGWQILDTAAGAVVEPLE